MKQIEKELIEKSAKVVECLKNHEKVIDEIKSDVKEVKHILINGSHKIAQNRVSIGYLKWVFGGFVALFTSVLMWIITQI